MDVSKTDTKAAMTNLLDNLQILGSDAELICKRHLEFVMAENKSRDWGMKSTLYAQTRIRGYGLTALWYEVRWYGKKATNTRRMVKTLIRKPARAYCYTPTVLAKHTQPWEEDMVREVEAALTEIRHKVSITSKAFVCLKQLERLENE